MSIVRPLSIDGELSVLLDGIPLTLRGSGRHLDIHLPGPRHWPALWRKTRALRALKPRFTHLGKRADVRPRVCWLGLKIPV